MDADEFMVKSRDVGVYSIPPASQRILRHIGPCLTFLSTAFDVCTRSSLRPVPFLFSSFPTLCFNWYIRFRALHFKD